MKKHQRVLVAEGAPFMRRAFVKALLRQRCYPITTSEIIIDFGVLYLKSANGKRPRLLPAIDVALIDDMDDKAVKGHQVIRELTARGITCIGIAAMPEFNDALSAAGAKLALKKGSILAGIYSGKLSMEVLKGQSQESLEQVSKYCNSYRSNKRLKKRIDTLVEEYLRSCPKS